MGTINIMPIKWFGNKESYMESPIRIVTVGLNPSHIEFRDNKKCKILSSKYRFPDFDPANQSSLEVSLNNYFKINPYSWFYAFDHILKGMNTSYWTNGQDNIALHTDFCTTWATDPTWSKLSQSDRNVLMKSGVPEWENLIKELKPDIILFSIPQQYINMLHLNPKPNILCSFDKTEKGVLRKRPVEITMGEYNNTLAVFGRTWNLPYGALGKEQKEELGRKILAEYKKMTAKP